jgi:hypothetical protein
MHLGRVRIVLQTLNSDTAKVKGEKRSKELWDEAVKNGSDGQLLADVTARTATLLETKADEIGAGGADGKTRNFGSPSAIAAMTAAHVFYEL